MIHVATVNMAMYVEKILNVNIVSKLLKKYYKSIEKYKISYII